MGSIFFNTCCCEHNCIIFPAPRPISGWNFHKQIFKDKQNPYLQFQVQLHKDFYNQDQQKVPYISVSNSQSRKNKQVIIYFHGNAQDIFHAIDFLIPIFKSTQITILCLQYPTYSCYETYYKYFISNRIKRDALDFHMHIQKHFKSKPQQIYIIGRSIGSGPASYLASQVNCSKLILISPFDSIKKVSMSHVGCIGFIIKNHFNNQQAILTHQGDLLVIHGKIDQVINFRHGKALVQVYESKSNKKCTFIQPSNMSHNYFDMAIDIVSPIANFLTDKSLNN